MSKTLESAISGSNEVPGTMMNAGVQTPEIDESGKVTRKAIKDGGQAYSIYNSLESDNRTRTSINAEIVARHGGKQPRDQKDLEAVQQNWRSNAPTLGLMGIEGRITARLVGAIDNLRVLTNSHLPDTVDGHDDKSKFFQEKLTSAVRKWEGWRPFISSLWCEDVLIGYACAAHLDDYNPWPRLFRSDEAFMPQGCAQFPNKIQVAGLKQSFLIDEAVQWLKDGEETADVAGFQFKNVIESVNKAMPHNPLTDQLGQGNLSRAWQDMIREGNVGLSFSTGAKGVDTAHVLAVEPDTQEVTHYIIDRNNEHNTLFVRENRFKSMADAVSLFTLEPGNGTYYGSKGVGRKCVNIVAAMDATFNDAVDAYRLSGLTPVKTDAKGGISTQMKVLNPFVMIATDGELSQIKFNFNPDAFVQLYSQIGHILEAAMGEYLPQQMSAQEPGQKQTATEANIDFQREREQSTAFVARALGQFFAMMQPIQRRLCDPETTFEEAKGFQKQLTDFGMTPEEIQILAECPTAEVVQDLAGQVNQQIGAIGEHFKGDPYVDQIKLREKILSALGSPQLAKELLLPDGIDPTIEAEQVRQQLLESAAMQIGESMPISPRDDDKVHLGVIHGQIEQAKQGLQKKDPSDPDFPQILDNLNALLVHGEAHIKSWAGKGIDPQELKPYEDYFKQKDAELTALAKSIQGAKQQQMQQQPQQDPAQQQGAPPQDAQQPQQPPPHVMAQAKISESINYKDAPESIKRQMEAAAGFTPATETPPNPQVQEVNKIAQKTQAISQPAPNIIPPVAQTP